MGVRGIHHLGVAVVDLDRTLVTYERLFGAELERRETIADQGVELAALRVGDSRVELMASLGADTPVGRFLRRRGPGMHHVAFEVAELERELERLIAGGSRLVDEVPRRGAFGLDVAFVHPDATGGVLAELVARG